ncbi:uncharacterized protein LOC124114888 isoform X2 [Haliotis rufescens]|uniref:uncharacterized protein LOC124114888 isoform X2 n=1 Tax=Haliotis rufescens TaxID=6454 RepID=UPI00201F04EE|nr:uncharacterized protein LOC124114888 isoform X2 [Haliotis rufescens]
MTLMSAVQVLMTVIQTLTAQTRKDPSPAHASLAMLEMERLAQRVCVLREGQNASMEEHVTQAALLPRVNVRTVTQETPVRMLEVR